jgi:hypothetical protein
MHRTLNLIFLFVFSSCAPVQNVDILPESTATQSVTPEPTQTFTPSATLARFTPTPTPNPCDAFTEDFCITDDHFILQRPIKPPANDIVDSTYPYASTARGTRDPHHGVEFLNGFGTPVYAARDGTVIFAGLDQEALYSPWVNFYGNVIVIEHDNDVFTLYAHLSKIDIQDGQDVHTGDKIGEVGQSGVATGSHLHFEVRRGDAEDYFSTVNPELWLAPNRDEMGNLFGAMMISVVNENADFQFSELTVNYYLDRSQPPVKSYYVITYSRDLSIGEENAAVGDLTPGNYRIALTMNGQVYERWVEVESGRLTQVAFIVK